MKIKDIITENIDTLEMMEDCQEILDVYEKTNGLLYRGVKNEKNYAIKKPIKVREKTYSMPKPFHELYHDVFQNNGLTATRKNSIFITPDQEVASNWGTNYVIFPPDGFEFTWFDSNETTYPLDALIMPVEDKLGELFEKHDIIFKPNKFLDNWSSDEWEQFKNEYPDVFKEILNTANETLKELGPRTDSLDEAIDENQEILIHAPYYYGIKEGQFSREAFGLD